VTAKTSAASQTAERQGQKGRASEASASKLTAPADRRQRILDAALRRHQYRQDALIEALHTAQNLYGFITPELLWYVAQQLHLPPSKVYGVATFYHFFTLEPAGAHSLVLCQGTACYIRGSGRLAAVVGERYGIDPGETTADKQLSLLTARCLGSCSLAPAAVLDGTVLSRLTPEALLTQLDQALAQPVPAAHGPAGKTATGLGGTP
jgi:bidirectional [NiFe] hydrogenase diaphorase subunit